MATQLGSYITFFTLVGDILRRQVFTSVGDISRLQANTREISDIFHFTAIHFLPERHSAMVLECLLHYMITFIIFAYNIVLISPVSTP